MGNTAKVDTPSVTYAAEAKRWKLIEALSGGTLTMREQCREWLPQEPAESDKAYQIRVGRSVLFEAFNDTLDDIGIKPFSKPVQVTELSGRLAGFTDNCDGTGSSLTAFAHRFFRSAVKYRQAHILVDFPAQAAGLSLADEREKGIRPRFYLVEAPALIGARTTEGPNGAPQTTQIRIAETRVEADGDWGDAFVKYIRVVEPGKWRLFKKPPDKSEFEQVTGNAGSGNTSMKRVALVTLTLGDKPPLEKLAWENLSHFQTSSDYKAALRFALFFLLFVKGLTKAERETPIEIAPGRMIQSASNESDAKILEPTGAALASGEKALAATEERMRALGMAAMTEKTGDVAATTKAIDEAGSVAGIKGWVRLCESALVEAFGLAAEWVGESLPADFKVDIFDEFSLSMRAESEMNQIIGLRRAGDLDLENTIAEFKRRGILAESVTVEDIKARLAEEGPSLAEMGLGGFGDPAEDKPTGDPVVERAAA